jgi:hypothetical protein
LPGDAPAIAPAPHAPDAHDAEPQDLQQPQTQTPASGSLELVWPPSDRVALRACALEWQRSQETGAAGSMIWREFLPACLERQRTPGK